MVIRFGLLLLAISLVSGMVANDQCFSEGHQPCMSKDEVQYENRYLYERGPYCYDVNNTEQVCQVGRDGRTSKCNCKNRACNCKKAIRPPVCKNRAPTQNCKADQRVYCPLAVTDPEKKLVIPHTLCSYCGVDINRCINVCDRGLIRSEKNQIVEWMNSHRRTVAYGNERRGNHGPQPQGGNLFELKWDDELAKSAQAWADQCVGGNDFNRQTKNREAVGQSIQEISLPKNVADKDLEGKIRHWYDQVWNWPKQHVPSYTTHGVRGKTTDYTQMVWANTKFVGCGYIATMQDGYSRTPYKQVLVCNYSPAGNIRGHSVYTEAVAGSLCLKGSMNGLCKH